MKNQIEQETPFLGALPDTRSEEEKSKDYRFEEIVASSAPVHWVEKQSTRRFPIFDQDGSGSCVAQTIAKLAGIMYAVNNDDDYVHFSATHVYQRRSNKPSGGMFGIDSFDIARKSITLEELVPSQSMTDAEMDGVEIPQYKDDVGKVFAFSNYVILPSRDIDTIASTIQKTGKGVMVWLYFKYSEWKREQPEVKYPTLGSRDSGVIRHSVTAVDYTLLPNGKKALIIEDSWGPETGDKGQRIIDEKFFASRNFFAAYPIDFKFETPETDEPTHRFSRNLEWSKEVVYDDEVVALQDILKYEGMFPANVESSGYYGSITAKAVLEWQLEYMQNYSGYPQSLIELQGRIVGPSTRSALNRKYA